MENGRVLGPIFRALPGKHRDDSYMFQNIEIIKKGKTGLGHLKILQGLKIKCCILYG